MNSVQGTRKAELLSFSYFHRRYIRMLWDKGRKWAISVAGEWCISRKTEIAKPDGRKSSIFHPRAENKSFPLTRRKKVTFHCIYSHRKLDFQCMWDKNIILILNQYFPIL